MSTKNQAQHTPTPWAADNDGYLYGRSTPIGILHVFDSLDKANAAFIVLAVNSHDALLEAAKKMADFLDMWKNTLAGVQMSQDVFDTDSGLSEALAVVAAVEGRAA